MARDTDRNAYHMVGMPKDSVTYQRLTQDALESNITIPSLIALRVADWYRFTSSGVPTLAIQSGSQGERDTSADQETTRARANAEAAAEAWLD